MIRIGIDLMGGDTPPQSLFAGVQQAAQWLSTQFNPPVPFTLVVFATPDVIQNLPAPTEFIQYQAVEQVIHMQDAPLTVIRTKKNSSLVRGIYALKDGNLDAFVSTGNTGALVACATLALPHLPDIDRPALLATLPTLKGNVAVLDVGSSTDVNAEHLLQFARLGAAYQRQMQGIMRPTVGLLNIGEESEKGTPAHRAAYALLQQEHPEFVFVGNVEGRDVFQGAVDVLVTDGFTGNVFLKTAEGISAYIVDSLKASLSDHAAFQALQMQLDYAQYPGAVLCGIDGVVIKCHGCSTARALHLGILGAVSLLR